MNQIRILVVSSFYVINLYNLVVWDADYILFLVLGLSMEFI